MTADCPNCAGDSRINRYNGETPVYKCDDEACPVHLHYRSATDITEEPANE